MVEQGATPRVSKARRRALKMAKSLTTPLLPDDYIELMNPMWTTRELRGEIVEIRPETEDASTIVIRPSADGSATGPASTCGSASRSTAAATGAPTR